MRWFRPPFPRLPVILVLALSAAALFSGCDRLALLLGITDPFKDYRDPKVNFIAASLLSNQDLTRAGFETPATWTWAWRGATDAQDGTGFDYMTLTLNGAATPPPGLPATTQVYDLELRNLISGGDFEWVGAIPADFAAFGWSYDPSHTTALTATGLGLHGKSLNANIGQLSPQSYQGLRFSLATLAEASGASQPHSYSLRFLAAAPSEYSSQLPLVGLFDASIDLPPIILDPLLGIQELSLPPMDWDIGAQKELVFGSKSGPTNLTFDDLRVLRSDIVSDYSLRLLLRPRDTDPNLVHGQGYEFSVWVRKPPSLYFVDEANAVAPYAARSISLRIKQLQPSAEGSTASSSIEVYSVESSTGWTRLVLRITNPEGTLDFPTMSSAAVVELAIIPFDSGTPEPGIVEIAAPELHFYLENN